MDYKWMKNKLQIIEARDDMVINEAETKEKLIAPIFFELGWDFSGKFVKSERAYKSTNVNVGTIKADWVLLDNNMKELAIIEAKSINVKLTNRLINEAMRRLQLTNAYLMILYNVRSLVIFIQDPISKEVYECLELSFLSSEKNFEECLIHVERLNFFIRQNLLNTGVLYELYVRAKNTSKSSDIKRKKTQIRRNSLRKDDYERFIYSKFIGSSHEAIRFRRNAYKSIEVFVEVYEAGSISVERLKEMLRNGSYKAQGHSIFFSTYTNKNGKCRLGVPILVKSKNRKSHKESYSIAKELQECFEKFYKLCLSENETKEC